MKILINSMILFAVFAIFIIATTLFLSPNDMANCSASPKKYASADSECVEADAIVAISGGNTSDRTKHAIDLYTSNWAKQIIFSGAAADKYSPSNAKAMKDQAVQAGVNPTDILIEEDAQNTKNNAELTKKIIIDNNIKSIILTTSGYHQKRAYLEFREALKDSGVKIINSPTQTDKDWGTFWWLSPRSWWLVFSEYAGIVIFYLGIGGYYG